MAIMGIRKDRDMDKCRTAEHRESRDRQILAWDDDILKRFWAKYSPPDINGCETWLGAPTSKGYGKFRADGEMFRPHRAATILRIGADNYAYQEVTLHNAELEQAGLCVGKLCGTHIKLGSQAENRQAPDSAKLTRPQVEEIRTRYKAGGVLQQELANEYGVNQPHVSDIVNNKRWVSTS
jgi:hypothetical protein